MEEQGTKKKILIVDDDPGVILLLKSRLEAVGYEVVSATNGQEAIAMVKQSMPNLVVLDRMMPKMDGIKACALLKSDRRFCRLPIIMATASAEKADQEISREVGVDAYINKPLNMVELMEKVQLLVNRV